MANRNRVSKPTSTDYSARRKVARSNRTRSATRSTDDRNRNYSGPQLGYVPPARGEGGYDSPPKAGPQTKEDLRSIYAEMRAKRNAQAESGNAQPQKGDSGIIRCGLEEKYLASFIS